MFDPSEMERIAGFPAAALHEAAPGSRVLSPDLRPVWAGARLTGPAFPVSQPGGDNGRLHRAIYAAAPGSVIVAITGARDYGYWGELMALAAQMRGLAGLVIDGGVRDVDALETLGFAVFASAICMRGTSKGSLDEGEHVEEVTVGNVAVRTGEIVVGDADGVLVLPRDGLTRILDRAEARLAREQEIRTGLAGGERLMDLVHPLTSSTAEAVRE